MASSPRVEPLESRQLLSSGRFAFDFGTPRSAVEPGYVGVSTEPYAPSRGYGWEPGSNLWSMDFVAPDPLRQDVVFVLKDSATFAVDLPNGDYEVKLTMGNTVMSHDAMTVYAEGRKVLGGLSTSKSFVEPQFTVSVADGQLNLTFRDEGGIDPFVVINALVIRPTAGSTPPPSPGPLDISAGGPYVGLEGSPVALTATASGGSGQGYSFAWDLDNDGSYETAGRTVAATFGDNGVYRVGLRVTDDAGTSANATATITIANVPPTANAGGPYSVTVSTPLTFQGSATDPSPADTAVGFSYAWDFGDGGTETGASPTHTYAAVGTYTATLRVTDKDGGVSAAVTAIVTVSTPPVVMPPATPNPMPLFPDFDATATLVSIASGSWSNPSTWSAGRVPRDGDVVVISDGTTVVYDIASEARIKTIIVGDDEMSHGDHMGPMAPTSMLRFRTDRDTRLLVGTIIVGHMGSLEIGTPESPVPGGVRSDIVFIDQAIDTEFDPFQYSNGLIGFGRVRISGAPMNDTYFRLATEAKVGDRTLTLSEPAIGWRPGDRLYLPDTRQNWNDSWGDRVNRWEEVTLASISADGRVLNLAAPLAYDHLGARDGDGRVDFLPHVANLSRNVRLSSENPGGTRGHVMFMGRADVDVRFAGFEDLGRTLNTPRLDSTSVDASGRVVHIGTNQVGRYPIHIHYLDGPLGSQANGQQFTLIGNAINGEDPSGTATLTGVDKSNDHRWGITIHSSHYGLIRSNVIYDVAGGGIVTEDGSESFNRIESNFISRVTGTGGRADGRSPDVSHEGAAIWLGGPNNIVRGNVVSTTNYGYSIDVLNLETIRIPTMPGMGRDSYQIVDMFAVPIRDFTGNEAYALGQAMDIWYVGIHDDSAGRAPRSVIKDLVAWHVGRGPGFYPAHGIVIDGLKVRGDLSQVAPWGGMGIFTSDYRVKGLIIKNADIQNMGVGVTFPTTNNGDADLVLEDSYLRNYTNVEIGTMWGPLFAIEPRKILIRDTTFATPNVPTRDGVPMRDIALNYLVHEWPERNLIMPDEVYVFNYNRIPGNSFRVYYEEQAANFIVPKTAGVMVGSPEAGLTNQQNWEKYGIAIAGSIAPSNAVRREKIKGLVVPF